MTDKQPIFTVSRSGPRCWEIMQGDKVSARVYSWSRDDQEAKKELEALAARFLDMSSLLKQVRFTIGLNLIDLRLKAMYHLIRFSCWIGGVGGVDLLDGDKKMSEINVQEKP